MDSKVEELFAFIRERHAIYERRFIKKLPKPWTDDVVLQSFRFCNVYREFDTVTAWISENWRTPYTNDHNVWFAMVVARLVNWPETLGDVQHAVFSGKTVIWKPDRFVNVMNARKSAGLKVFSGAYIVSTNGRAMDKAEYLAEQVLTPLWEARKKIGIKSSLEELYKSLLAFQGMGSFMSAQVVADVKYTMPYLKVPDWWTFAASGPGSRRGLNRVLNLGLLAHMPENRWHQELLELKAKIDPLVKKAKMPPLHAQDLQNCLCEFDKYQRVLHKEGYPRSNYPGV